VELSPLKKMEKTMAEGMRSSILSVLNITGEKDVKKFFNLSGLLLTSHFIPHRISEIIFGKKGR